MRVMSATEVKNKLGDALSFADNDSLLIEKNGKEAFMAFSFPTAKKMILTSYANGGMSRSDAMNLLGFSWYGELLDALALARITKQSLPEGERAEMVLNAKSIFGVKAK